jgi:peroxiredoxin
VSNVNLPNIDTKVWDYEFRAVDIVSALIKNGAVTISMDSEGPDLRENKIYELLNYICELYNFDKKSITITTRNLLEEHTEYNIKINAPFTFVKMCQDYARDNVIPDKDFSKVKHFGIFIGRSNWQRLWLAAVLHNLNNSVITYHYDHKNDSHNSNLGLDFLSYEISPTDAAEITAPLLSQVPILRDKIVGYPIDGRKPTQPSLNAANFSSEYMVEIVCETYTSGKTFFPTEKTYRPIMCRAPFIIQGPTNFLTNLKVLGFKTFNQWWDESYDYQPGRTKIEEIIKIINMLSSKSALELETMYNEMLPTLEHNYNVLMNLTPEQMLSANYVK